MKLNDFVEDLYNSPRWWNYLLFPLSLIFYTIISLRKFFYYIKFLKKNKFEVPIIVVGNLTIGGTGKTPLVIYLVEQLRQRGFRPAVVSRGYGRRHCKVQIVTPESSAEIVGDEPLLILHRTRCPVIVGAKRKSAVNLALEKTDCNIIISDDGLQHYKLERNVEIVVLDGTRRFGNEMLLPAGPLREPLSRLQLVDFIVNNGDERPNEIPMNLKINKVFRLYDQQVFSLDIFAGKTIHAVAGIGNPKRFFNTLIGSKIKIIPHAFPDHYLFHEKDLNFWDELPILMTEKDAVKCYPFVNKNMYCVSVTAVLPDNFIGNLLSKLPCPTK